MENRNCTRVPFSSRFVMKSRGAVIAGEVEDVSLKGVFLKTAQKLEIGENVLVRLWVPDDGSEVGIDFIGVVTRHVPQGMAVQFTGMCLESYGRLRSVIARQLGDSRKVFQEFLAHMTQGAEPDCRQIGGGANGGEPRPVRDWE